MHWSTLSEFLLRSELIQTNKLTCFSTLVLGAMIATRLTWVDCRHSWQLIAATETGSAAKRGTASSEQRE